jgi:hypothetical protein
MNKLLTVCLICFSISSTALAVENLEGSPDWQSQQGAPEAFTMVADIDKSVVLANNPDTQVTVPEGSDLGEALDLGMQVLEAINAGKMQLVLGLLLMILIWTLRSFWSSFPPDIVPWLTAGIAILGSAAMGLLSGWPWEKIVTDALTISTSAGGLWSLIGKHISNLGFGKK